VRVKRLEGESEAVYRFRAERIAEIVGGFRHGRYRGEVAEAMDRELTRLLSPVAAPGTAAARLDSGPVARRAMLRVVTAERPRA
jgi:hypothetical protein